MNCALGSSRSPRLRRHADRQRRRLCQRSASPHRRHRAGRALPGGLAGAGGVTLFRAYGERSARPGGSTRGVIVTVFALDPARGRVNHIWAVRKLDKLRPSNSADTAEGGSIDVSMADPPAGAIRGRSRSLAQRSRRRGQEPLGLDRTARCDRASRARRRGVGQRAGLPGARSVRSRTQTRSRAAARRPRSRGEKSIACPATSSVPSWARTTRE